MDQCFLAAVCRIIVGPTGRRLPAYSSVEAAFTQGLFKDYYLYNSVLCHKTYYKYLNESAPFPHFLVRHYGGANDYRRTLSDMMELVDNCPSIVLLRQIQCELYQFVVSYLPDNEATIVCRNYVNQKATRREIAVFLADTLHCAIVRNPVKKIRAESKDG